MGYIIVIVALILTSLIGFGGYYLYVIMQEQKDIVQETDKDFLINAPNERFQYTEAVNDSNFETLLTHSLKSEDKLDELREAIQEDLRRAVKEKNIPRSRECNKYLKKLDQAERRTQG